MTAGRVALEDYVDDAASTAATNLAAHEIDTTGVHGISDTSVLETTSGAQAKVDAEAALARNADNLSSGTVADARIASTIARDSEVTAAIAAEATARDAAIATAVTGLLEFKGTTDASTNPNYPAASKGDAYVVSVAGKVGGASGKSVDVGDIYLATADNAGGTEASVGTSWTVLEHNLVGALLAGNNLSDLTNAGTARTNLGLGNVDNTADSAKTFTESQITNLVTDLAAKAPTTRTISAGTGLSGGGSLAADRTLSIDTATTVDKTTAQTLTNKTLTSPAITTPTGIVKGDVGLGNVDNTSNATERAAAATLTNKTIDGGSNTIQNVPESAVTNLVTDLGALQTEVAVAAAQRAAIARAFSGYYVGAGLALSASGTAGKLDMAVGMGVRGTTDLGAPAQTAISTTITSLADATNPKWVWVELDGSNVVQFNQGTAAASPALPDITASRIPLGLLYVPANATAVDALLTTSNGKAKLIDMRQVLPGPSIAGWCYEQNTWVFVSSTTGAGGGLITYKLVGIDVTGYLKPGTKVAWDDGTNVPGYGVIASSAFSTDTTITLIKQSDYVMANATIKYARFSYEEAPQGFPSAFNWSPTLSGWSSDPTTLVYRWSLIGTRKVLLTIRQGTNGTSNAATHTATLPVSAATVSNMVWANNGTFTDNNVVVAGSAIVASAGSTVALAGLLATGNNTGSGNSRVNSVQVQYEF